MDGGVIWKGKVKNPPMWVDFSYAWFRMLAGREKY